ncbi:hypothetical protein vseg_013248 [Gypsophila vaccaria]
MRKLITPRVKELQQTPSSPLLEAFPAPLPTISLIASTTQPQLLAFLTTHLRPPITPQTLLHFLKKKLHYHTKFTHLDFHIFQWTTTIDSYRHDHNIYEWMVRTLAITDRFDDLRIVLLERMPSMPCPCADGIFCCPRIEPIFRFAINSFCRVGRLDDALLAFDTIRKLIDGRPSVVLYNILIHGFVKHGQHDKALRLYDRIVQDRLNPDVYTFNILISGYCKCSMFGSALALFKEMRAKGCEPNVVTFNTLIRGFFRDRKIEEGVAMAYEMIDLGCQISTVTCEILVNGLCQGGRTLAACDLLIDFLRKGVLPQGFDCSDLIERLCRENPMWVEHLRLCTRCGGKEKFRVSSHVAL